MGTARGAAAKKKGLGGVRTWQLYGEDDGWETIQVGGLVILLPPTMRLVPCQLPSQVVGREVAG